MPSRLCLLCLALAALAQIQAAAHTETASAAVLGAAAARADGGGLQRRRLAHEGSFPPSWVGWTWVPAGSTLDPAAPQSVSSRL